jgi:hypothetical protein
MAAAVAFYYGKFDLRQTLHTPMRRETAIFMLKRYAKESCFHVQEEQPPRGVCGIAGRLYPDISV